MTSAARRGSPNGTHGASWYGALRRAAVVIAAAIVIAVVKAGKNQSAAQAFVKKVLSPQGQAMLQDAGFGKP